VVARMHCGQELPQQAMHDSEAAPQVLPTKSSNSGVKVLMSRRQHHRCNSRSMQLQPPCSTSAHDHRPQG
jgi:hypothetical protein